MKFIKKAKFSFSKEYLAFFLFLLLVFPIQAFSGELYQKCTETLLSEYRRLGFSAPDPQIEYEPHPQDLENVGIRYLPSSSMGGLSRIRITSSIRDGYVIQELCKDPYRTGLVATFIHESFHYIMDQEFESFDLWANLSSAFASVEGGIDPYTALIEGFAIAGEVYYSEHFKHEYKLKKRLPLVKEHLSRVKLLTHTKNNPAITQNVLRDKLGVAQLWYSYFLNNGILSLAGSREANCKIPSECIFTLAGQQGSSDEVALPVIVFNEPSGALRWSFLEEEKNFIHELNLSQNIWFF